jgi:hypothetical protein
MTLIEHLFARYIIAKHIRFQFEFMNNMSTIKLQRFTLIGFALTTACAAGDFSVQNNYGEGKTMNISSKILKEMPCKIPEGYSEIDSTEMRKKLQQYTVKLVPFITEDTDIEIISSIELLLPNGTHQVLGTRSPYFGQYNYSDGVLMTYIDSPDKRFLRHGRFFMNYNSDKTLLVIYTKEHCRFVEAIFVDEEG